MADHWRDSSRNPRLFMVDAYAVFPLVLVILHIKSWTFMLAIGSITFFAILEKFKFTIPVFFRWVRSTLAGPVRSSTPWWRE